VIPIDGGSLIAGRGYSGKPPSDSVADAEVKSKL
jgi:hypothetical protein